MNTQKKVNNSDQDEEGCLNRNDGYSDSFVVVDIETLSSSYSTPASTDRDTSTTTNSRTNFQRSLSRKASSHQQRGKTTVQKDSTTVALGSGGGGGGGGGVADDLSTKAGARLPGEFTSDNIKLTMMNGDHHHPLVVAGGGGGVSGVGLTHENMNSNNKKGQQTVTITATESSSRWRRSYSRQRSSSSLNWIIMDPRRILFLFATLSSMGTLILIYFTLSVGRLNNNGGSRDYS